MAVLCRVPTLEETLVQVCAEVCTCCPTLNAAQVAGCGTVFLVLVGTLLGSPPATSSLRERRPPDFHLKKIKTTKRATVPAYAGLRAVHTPAVTPVVGYKRMALAARGGTHACLGKTSDESMHTLQETPLIGQHTVGIPGEHRQIPMGLLAGAVGLVLVGKIVHKVLRRIGAATLEENRAKLERIFYSDHNQSQNLGGRGLTESAPTYIKLAPEQASLLTYTGTKIQKPLVASIGLVDS